MATGAPMIEDRRESIHKDLHGRQLAQEEGQNRESALRILKILFDYVEPKSVLDVGCGLGTWLRVAQELGLQEVHGIEGSWLDTKQLQVDPTRVTILDLERGFNLGRRFDLAFCLEVGEHLSPSAADPLVASLVAHTDTVLFSAAIPFQGGHHHVNEQFPDYWSERFARYGFRPIDLLRPRIWDDRAMHWWLRQNVLIFAHERVIAANAKLQQESEVPRALCIVHPDVYLGRMRLANNLAADYQKLLTTLGHGGVFRVRRQPDGSFNFSRVE